MRTSAITPTDFEFLPSPPSPLTREVMGAIEKVTGEMWPGLPVLPIMSTGATDSRYLRNAGIPSYGTSGMFYDIDDNRAHGRDERIRVASLYDGQEYLYRLVKLLAGGGSHGKPGKQICISQLSETGAVTPTELYLAIDQGGHASRAILFDGAGHKLDEAVAPVATRRDAQDASSTTPRS